MSCMFFPFTILLISPERPHPPPTKICRGGEDSFVHLLVTSFWTLPCYWEPRSYCWRVSYSTHLLCFWSPVNNGMFFYDSPLERMVDGKFKSTLSLLGFGTFVGTGRNFRIAKSSAAQKALNALKQKMKKKSWNPLESFYTTGFNHYVMSWL